MLSSVLAYFIFSPNKIFTCYRILNSFIFDLWRALNVYKCYIYIYIYTHTHTRPIQHKMGKAVEGCLE